MPSSRYSVVLPFMACLLLVGGALGSTKANAQRTPAQKMDDATEVLTAFTLASNEDGIPADLIARAQGIAVIPDVFRGGFFLGGRRGRGVLSIRSDDGSWTQPAFVTLTGGSVGWQFGVETIDLILIFANEASVRAIERGRFTLGADATAVAGPAGRRATVAVTFKAEVYSYTRSQGLFAGAAFEGAKLGIDGDAALAFYGAGDAALTPANNTPLSASAFLQVLRSAAIVSAGSNPPRSTEIEETQTFPLQN